MKHFVNWQCQVERCTYFFTSSLNAQSDCQSNICNIEIEQQK